MTDRIPSPTAPAASPRENARGRFKPWKILLGLAAIPITGAVAAAMMLMLAIVLANERLPSMSVLLDYRPKIPLRIYSSDGLLMGEFGEERRSFIAAKELPLLMRSALLSAEDERFFEHSGVDPLGVVRAIFDNATGRGRGGASTITQQVARNFYLSSERSYIRKVFEVLLALRIEESLSKEQILEIYINHIFLGRRAYGFAAAAQIYYGRSLTELTPAQAAMLAGLPKAPSEFNPVVNPRRARIRQLYVLGRMRALGYLTEAEYRSAVDEPPTVRASGMEVPLQAPYVAEMARQLTEQMFREDTYTLGLKVYTSVQSSDQRAANRAVREGILGYDRKYGYRGPEAFIELSSDFAAQEDAIADALADHPDVDDYLAAVVVEATTKSLKVSRGRGQVLEILGDGVKFATTSLGPADRIPAAKRLRRGAVVRIWRNRTGAWEVVQVPEVESAFIAINAKDGATRALVGGFDFGRNKFNRVTQAWRQPGSSFKPFIYSAALEKGFTPATLVDDSPFHVDAATTGGQPWDPKNYDGKYDGPMPMRTGLARSKNMVSVRLLQAIGPRYAQDYVTRFGFDAERHPAYLTMALGAGSVTLWQMARAYGVFANGGYRVEPWLVQRIVDGQGRLLAQAHPDLAGKESLRVVDERNAYLMNDMLQGVVRAGTATRALSLKRNDLAGKTGTTNDAHDAWFAGYNPDLVGIAWVGYDQPRKLGDRETGGGLALPIWIAYMEHALNGKVEREIPPPLGIIREGNDWVYQERSNSAPTLEPNEASPAEAPRQ
jgi:penicillin-binding protein 1A